MSIPGPIEDHVVLSSFIMAGVLAANALFFIWYRKSESAEDLAEDAKAASDEQGEDFNASATGAANARTNTMDAFAAVTNADGAATIPDYDGKKGEETTSTSKVEVKVDLSRIKKV